MFLYADDQFTLVLEVEINGKKIHFAIFYNGQHINFIKVDVSISNSKKLQIDGIVGIFEDKEVPNQINMTPYYLCIVSKTMNINSEYDSIEKIQFVHIPKKPSSWITIDHLITSIDQQHGLYDLELYLNEQSFYRTHKIDVENQYIWNHSSIKPFMKILDMYDIPHQCLVFLVLGYVDKIIVPLQNTSLASNQQIELSICSLVSVKRTGTRYSKRGLDDEGYCANQVFSRMQLTLNQKSFSFELLRASVPVFWEQTPSKISITRPLSSSLHAISNHFQHLLKHGNFLVLFNLLDSNNMEGELSDMYEQLVLEMQKQFYEADINYVHFDYHNLVKQAQDVYLLKHLAMPYLQKISYSSHEKQQQGMIRINCLDVLDRTNVVHHQIFLIVLELMAKDYPILKAVLQPHVLQSFSELFANHGDVLSIVYTGTGAVKSSFTRHGKMTWAGVLDDGFKSINRYVNSKLTDVKKQYIIEWLISSKIMVQNDLLATAYTMLREQDRAFTNFKELQVYVCTWNVNGQLPYADISPLLKQFNNAPIVVIGLQEIVELTPNQVISTDYEKKQVWESKFATTLQDYHLVKSIQVVGTAIFIFIKNEYINAVSKVDYKIKKTGFSGMAGNKGGILVKLNIYDTAFVFITAHLAAGQEQLLERIKDVATISDVLFDNEKLSNIRNVIWFGDFNYRIDFYTNEQIRQHIKENNLPLLFQYDQVI
eukprot:NODE_297_length_10490_cov_1.102974.p2 type:complete len:710 gc:universal NODE_297_length_10490_cov_1.102974:6239-4110(-)